MQCQLWPSVSLREATSRRRLSECRAVKGFFRGSRCFFALPTRVPRTSAAADSSLLPPSALSVFTIRRCGLVGFDEPNIHDNRIGTPVDLEQFYGEDDDDGSIMTFSTNDGNNDGQDDDNGGADALSVDDDGDEPYEPGGDDELEDEDDDEDDDDDGVVGDDDVVGDDEDEDEF